ncbi:MAG: tetratricopeptide (TPR) repeat protein [Lentimonas sp.]
MNPFQIQCLRYLKICGAISLALGGSFPATSAATSVATSAATGLSAQQRQLIEQELQAPIRITLSNRGTVIGHSIRVSDERIIIGTSEGAGEAIFTFKLDEVRAFEIPGESYKPLAVEWLQAGQQHAALELFELLYQQRVNMLPLLPPSESHFFIYYAELALQLNKPAQAIGIITKLRPQIENIAALHAVDDAILNSYQQLELYDQARPLAQDWVATRAPYGNSGLGHYVLGTAALRDQDYATALELALQPIVFSSPLPTAHLAHCYAVAISAALGLREPDYATTLFREMQQRELSWPANDTTLQSFHGKLLQRLQRLQPPEATTL